MITPRRTRLVRVADLHQFRQVIAERCGAGAPASGSQLVVVPTRTAAALAELAIAPGAARSLLSQTAFVTRSELYDAFHSRLARPPRLLTSFERDALVQAAAVEAAAASDEPLPFQVRPGLVAELLRLYDQLRRQSQVTQRFEELMTQALGGNETEDRGAIRLLQQTRFLAGAFTSYEQRVAASGAIDEHGLRDLLCREAADDPIRDVIVTVPDWIADPDGLFAGDFDLLTRVPGLETLDILCTASVLGSGFHERIHTWWPGLEEIDGAAIVERGPILRPTLMRPPPGPTDSLWFTYRDREEELLAVARKVRGSAVLSSGTEPAAIVYKRPLPYLYLAPDTLGASGVEYQTRDGLPLAAEPMVATLDLLIDAAETDFSRQSLVALLASPYLRWHRQTFNSGDVAAMNVRLSGARYLGGLDRLSALGDEAGEASPALAAAIEIATALLPLTTERTVSAQLGLLALLLDERCVPVDGAHFTDREIRARGRMLSILNALADAHRRYHDPLQAIGELARTIRRWIGDETFEAGRNEGRGLYLVDDQAARYGNFADITIVGLIESEWPERPRRNIFYPARVLKALGWPSERDRRGAADARFVDLLGSASRRVELSTFLLDDEAIVTRSVQLDEVPLARLSTDTRDLDVTPIPAAASAWDDLRSERTDAGAAQFHGDTGPRPPRAWSVSALEVYLSCPFKFFAQHVLKLEEEPDDEEVMDPRRQGQLVHEVFETFFTRWQAAGHREIRAGDLLTARELFATVADEILLQVPEAEAGLERTRLLGSAAASGLGEAVFRMEAERPTPVIERLIEHPFNGPFTMQTSAGPRTVHLRGKVDRIDLLADGTFRLIDYKLGWPPDKSRALQLPIYGTCAEQQLAGHRGRNWTMGEAVYLAFKGPRRVVPLFRTPEQRVETVVNAQQRLVDAIDSIERGLFPPSPQDVYQCDICAFASVCRKDYVGDV